MKRIRTADNLPLTRIACRTGTIDPHWLKKFDAIRVGVPGEIIRNVLRLCTERASTLMAPMPAFPEAMPWFREENQVENRTDFERIRKQ